MSINQEELKKRISCFLEWFNDCNGSEKSESQEFLIKLFQAFGNSGVREAGAEFEKQIKMDGTTKPCDLVWIPRVLIEMKSRGKDLSKFYDQGFNYWINLVPDRPKYMVLCNFDEFWIYDLNAQIGDPVHKLQTKNLKEDWPALAFLFPSKEEPIFDNHNIKITEEAAKTVGGIYQSLISRSVDEFEAQKFTLQSVVALFSEDVGLIPKSTVYKILRGLLSDSKSSNEDMNLLFKAMSELNKSNKPKQYKDIPYFNGSIFKTTSVNINLKLEEIEILYDASKHDWKKVRPSIFGSVFEGSTNVHIRHAHGMHYTSESDIQKIVGPTITQLFRERIDKANTVKGKKKVLEEIRTFKVLDPACGSGNFLYIAFRELRRLEMEILKDLEEAKKIEQSELKFLVSPKNFYGIDTNRFGLELAKVALSIGRKISADEYNVHDNTLPFDDLENNFFCEDALFAKWPKVDAIIGNPPFLGSKKMKVELPVEYVNKVRTNFPEVPGRADYCVYWFRKAHDNLQKNQRAGLVGTNTIRENYSREGGLDYIVKNKGTITEAVSTQVWSGEASVYVSIVNWMKGDFLGKKKLSNQLGNRIDSPWNVEYTERINSSLTSNISVKGVHVLQANNKPKRTFQGQNTSCTDGFLISNELAKDFCENSPINCDVVFSCLQGEDLLTLKGKNRKPTEYMIDFGGMGNLDARRYKEPFKHIENIVLPQVKFKAEKNSSQKKERERHLNIWWQHWRHRAKLKRAVRRTKKFIAISRVAKEPAIFDFVSSSVRITDALQAFVFEDNYSFGILQSKVHTLWFRHRCSTLGSSGLRYTGDTVFSTFPWPQNPSSKQVKKVSETVSILIKSRQEIMEKNKWGLRDLYDTLNEVGKNPLRDIHTELDKSVMQAYGMENMQGDENYILQFLLDLNHDLYKKEQEGKGITAPGLPPSVKNAKEFIIYDCIKP